MVDGRVCLLYPVFGWVVRVTQFGDGGVYLTCQKKIKNIMTE